MIDIEKNCYYLSNENDITWPLIYYLVIICTKKVSTGSHRCKTHTDFNFLLRGVGGDHHGQRSSIPCILPSHESPVTEESATGRAFSLEAENPRNALSEPLAARAEVQHQPLGTHTPDSETKITV